MKTIVNAIDTVGWFIGLVLLTLWHWREIAAELNGPAQDARG